jgi:hypothetical protein
MGRKRHQYREGEPQKEFCELSYAEQAKSINMTRINLERMKEAHRRRGREEGRDIE